MTSFLTRIASAVAAATCVMTASAANVDMTGWQTWGGIAAAANSSTTVAVPSGVSGVSSMSFANLNYDAINGSWRSEFLIRVEVAGSTSAFWTLKPSTDTSGGNWSGSADGASCTYAGGPFTIPAGTTSIKVFVYESYNDGGDGVQDAQVNSGTLTINFGNPPPPFDACTQALNGTVGVNNLTLNGTAPDLVGVTCGGTTIYKANYVKFVAPSTSRFTADTCAAATGDTVMAVLTTCGNSASALACNDDTCGLRSQVSWDGTAGTTYYIAVGGYSATTSLPSPMPVTISEAGPPFDACAGATTGTVGVNTLPINTAAADLVGACGATTVYKANYVRFVAPQTGRYLADTCATGTGDTKIAALTTCGDGASALACNDDACGLQSSIAFDTTAGQTYWIAVGGYSATTVIPNPVTVTIGEAPPPFDACADPPVGTVGTNTLPMNPGAADLDIYWAGVTVYKCNYLKFTPTQDGIFTVSNCANDAFDSWIIRATDCGNADAVIDGNDDGCGIFAGPSSLQFQGTAGVTYYLGIGGYTAGTQLPTECIVEIEAQYCTSGFNACAEAVTVPVGSTPIEIDCGAATLDLTGYWTPDFGDPAIGQANYVRFVAPTTGQYEANLCSVADDQRLAVLTTCGDASTFIAADDDGCTGGAAPYNSKVSWAATAGTTYYIAVGSYVQGGVVFSIGADQVITIGEVAPPANPCAPENVVTAVVGGTYPVSPDPAYPDLDMTGSACVFAFNPQTISHPKYLKLTPTVSGQHTLSTCTDAGGTVDSRIACLATCGVAGSTIACDDDGCTGGAPPYTSSLTVDLVAGVTYYFAVGGYNAAATGPFTVQVFGPSGPPPCFGDLNLDGFVNGADLTLLLGNWGQTGIGDLNNDGVVNGADIALLLGAWGTCP